MRIAGNVEWRFGCRIVNDGRISNVCAKQLDLFKFLRSDSENRNHRARDEMRGSKLYTT